MKEQDGETDRQSALALANLGWLLIIGAAAALAAVIAADWDGLTAAVGICVLIFLAAFSVGGFFGFLFGVPRVLSGDTSPTTDARGSNSESPKGAALAAPQNGGAAKKPARLRLLSSNTNLERISDWLTTMIVGATLVELHRINGALLAFRNFLDETARVFPRSGAAPTAGVVPLVGTVVLVLGATCGFLFMYLQTRLVLVLLFDAIERRISGDTKLSLTTQRAVQAFVRSGTQLGSFVGNVIDTTRRVTVQDALGLMFNLLYKDAPDEVVELGRQLRGTDAEKRADYWFYLAAAFGQKLLKIDDRNSDEWKEFRLDALDCATRAIAVDPGYRNRLWEISDPGSSDNDLSALRPDPDFRHLVGRRPK